MGWSEGEGNGGGRVARDGSRLTDTEAKKIILDLIDAGHDGALVPLQDGGAKVDVILSQIEGRGHLVMGRWEAESRTDRAIRQAWRALTGQLLAGDPVVFINS